MGSAFAPLETESGRRLTLCRWIAPDHGKSEVSASINDFRWDEFYMAPSARAGEVILEERVATNPEAMKKTFEKMPASRIALETGTHSPWVSRLLTELGHDAIVAHSRNVRLIGESRRKDERLDAQGSGAPTLGMQPSARTFESKQEIFGVVSDGSMERMNHPGCIRFVASHGRILNLDDQGATIWVQCSDNTSHPCFSWRTTILQR